MITAETFMKSVRHEVGIIRHLAGKVPPGTLDWRPSPVQRSTLELLRYLSTAALVPATFIRDGNWEAGERLQAEGAALDPADFDAAMVRQEEALGAIVAGFTEEEFLSRPTRLPWGTPCLTGEGLVEMVLKTLVAYRMQLFLYAKASGNHDLGPANCWAGVDRKPPAGAGG